MRRLYGGWEPDRAPHLTEGLVTASGVYPIANGYAPLPSFAAAVNGTLAATCIGAAAYRAAGTVRIFAGTTSNIYLYDAGTGWGSIKGSLTSNATVGYRFVNYNDLLLITNGVDPIQQFDPGSPSATTDLDASAPDARFLAVVRGYVIAGYCDDDPLRLQWSAFGDPTEWTPGTLDAGLFQISSGGDITGLVGGEYGLIFKENAIFRMSPTGDDSVWQFDEIVTDIGCIAPWSLATAGKLTFFLSSKGWMATDGVTVEAIGNEKIDRTFFELLDRTYIDNMSAAGDPRGQLLFIAVPSANPTTQVFIYHYALQQWSTASITSERIFPALSNSINIEGLDAIYSNLDSVPVSLDSPLFRGGYPLLMLFDGSHRLGTLSGSNMAATLLDARIEPVPGRRARVTDIRPIDDAAAGALTISVADNLTATGTPVSYNVATSRGRVFKTRSSGNIVQVQREIPAGTDWSYAQGYDLGVVDGGRA